MALHPSRNQSLQSSRGDPITHRPEELRQFPEVRRLKPPDLGDAADPAVPGQGGDEAEQVRYPDLEDRLAGQVRLPEV
jgi:hypothetical protein